MNKENELELVLEQCEEVVNRKIPLLVLAPEYTKILLDYIKELHNKIDKLKDKIKQMDNRFKNGLCIDNYLGGTKTRKLFEEMYEILKDSDVDDN